MDRIRKFRHWWPVGIFVGFTLLYFLTGAKTMTGFGDSDELIAAGYTFSLPHQPGFPLFTLLLGFFTHLPLMSPQMGAAVFAAVIQAAALTVLYLFVTQQFSASKSLAGFGVVLAGLSFRIWEHGSYIEVFSFTGLLVVSTWLIGYRYCRHRTINTLLLLAMFVGGGIAHHPLFAVAVLPLLVWLSLPKPESSPGKRLKSAALFAGTATLAFAVLYVIPVMLLGRNNLIFGWQFTPSARGVLNFYFRNDFSGYSAQTGWMHAWFGGIQIDQLVYSLKYYLEMMWKVWGLLLAVGLVSFINFNRIRHHVALIIAMFILGPVFGAYMSVSPSQPLTPEYEASRAIVNRIYLLADYIYAAFVVIGFVQLIESIQSRTVKIKIFQRIPLVYLACTVLIAVVIGLNFQTMNLSGYKAAAAYARTMLDSLPPNSRLVCLSDVSCFGLSYQQIIEYRRPDVQIISIAKQFRYEYTKNKFEPFIQRYGDNPYRLGEIIGWSLHAKIPVFLTEINPVMTKELGLDVDAFYTYPFGGGLQIAKDLLPADQIKQHSFNANVVNQIIAYNRHPFVKVMQSIAIEQAAVNGTMYARMRSYDVARSNLATALVLNPDNTDIKKMYTALDSYPGDPRYQNNAITDGALLQRVSVCEKKIDSSCALYPYQWLVWRTPDSPLFRLQLAKQYQQAGMLPFARREYESTLLLDPENASAKQALENLSQIKSLPVW